MAASALYPDLQAWGWVYVLVSLPASYATYDISNRPNAKPTRRRGFAQLSVPDSPGLA